MRDANAQSEARKTADRRQGRSKLVIYLLKRTFEKVSILLNNRGMFIEWTLPVSEKHQHRLQVCENNWVRRIAGVKRVDRRRMDELIEEVGIQECLMGRLVKSRLKWAGHVERVKEDRLPRMAYVHQKRGKRKRGRPRMRWRDYIERDMRKAELEDVDWRMVAQDRGQWRRFVHRAAETCSHPYT